MGTAFSRDDHVHPAHTIRNVPEIAPLVNRDQCLRVNALGTSYSWDTCPGSKLLPAPSASRELQVPRVERGGSSYEVVQPSTIVGSGLPGLTGNAGKVLTVNSGATGFAWEDAGSDISEVNGMDIAISGTTISSENCAPLRAGHYLLSVIRGTATATVGVGEVSSYPLTINTSPANVTVNETGNCAVSQSGVSLHLVSFGTQAPPGPSIPDPSGARNYLRVDAAGNAYELGQLPFGSDIQPLLAGNAIAPGADNDIARADHVHRVATFTSTPAPLSSAGSAGTSDSFARGDHVHP